MSDEGPGFFADKHVAIFGLGLMGGSAAMALKGHCRLLTGIDPDPKTEKIASQQGVVDRVICGTGILPEDVDLIILASPVKSILSLLSQLPEICPTGAVVLDFGSTKQIICEAMQSLPEQFDPIGGHPMCGKETSGLTNADPSIFKKAMFVLVRTQRSTPVAEKTVEAFVKIIGARPFWLDAETHDAQVAATSHLPYLAANSLACITPVDAAPLAATGFASTTRLALTPPSMMLDVLQTNQEAILKSLHQYREHLTHMENLLSAGEWHDLSSLLLAGAEHRKQIDLSHKGN